MGKKSNKENKSIYQEARDKINMTRAAVEDATGGILTSSRVEKNRKRVTKCASGRCNPDG